ncbi:MAG: hypothetical protein AB1861_20585, partial [Cyanobacteriota bacterium]
MAKKRISDLLHEEAQKSPDLEAEPVLEATVEEIIEVDAEIVNDSSTDTSGKTSDKNSNSTAADLEATVTELK